MASAASTPLRRHQVWIHKKAFFFFDSDFWKQMNTWAWQVFYCAPLLATKWLSCILNQAHGIISVVIYHATFGDGQDAAISHCTSPCFGVLVTQCQSTFLKVICACEQTAELQTVSRLFKLLWLALWPEGLVIWTRLYNQATCSVVLTSWINAEIIQSVLCIEAFKDEERTSWNMIGLLPH